MLFHFFNVASTSQNINTKEIPTINEIIDILTACALLRPPRVASEKLIIVIASGNSNITIEAIILFLILPWPFSFLK